MWGKRSPYSLVVGVQINTAIWKSVWRFFKKLKIALPDDPAMPLLVIYSKYSISSIDIYVSMSIAALFTIAQK